jgi:hypothetical protein
LRLGHLLRDNFSAWRECLQEARNVTYDPEVADLWQYGVIQRHQPLWGWNRSNTNWARVAASAVEFSSILGANRNRVSARFYDAAGSLYIIFFSPSRDYFQGSFPMAPASQWQQLARVARTLRLDTTSVLIRWLQQQRETFIPPTPSESEASLMNDESDGDSRDSNPEVTQRPSAGDARPLIDAVPVPNSGDEGDSDYEMRVS